MMQNGQMGGMGPMMGRPQPPQFNAPPDKKKAQKKQREIQKLREQAQAEGQNNRMDDYDDVLSSFDAVFQKNLKEGKAKKLEEKEIKRQEKKERQMQLVGTIRQMVGYQMMYQMYNRVSDASDGIENLQSSFENRDVTGGSYSDATADRYSEIINDSVKPDEEIEAAVQPVEEHKDRPLPQMDTSDADELQEDPGFGNDYY